MNTATIIGRAGQDAEIKYFESGKVKTTFSLAVGRWDSNIGECGSIAISVLPIGTPFKRW